jgi:hypothetical protein
VITPDGGLKHCSGFKSVVLNCRSCPVRETETEAEFRVLLLYKADCIRQVKTPDGGLKHYSGFKSEGLNFSTDWFKYEKQKQILEDFNSNKPIA